MHHSFDFSHDKIRAVVYRAAVPERRRVLHGQVGQALEQLFPDRIEEQAGLLAYHWERAGDQARATEHLLRAGDQARLVYAHQTAVDYYRRALGFLTGQGEYERAARTLMKLGLTYHNDFDFRQARRAYDEGLALWQRVSRVAAAAPASQTLRVRWEEPTSLDPILSPDAHTSELMTHVFSALVELSPEMGIVPDVARSWQVSEDGCSLTFHLREDARWSDGTPVTAEDFAYAWRRALESPISVLTANSMCEIVGVRALRHGNGCWEDVGVRVPDPLTLQVELEVPAGYFLHLLAHTPYYPVPRHVVERHGDAWADPETMVTNGPFKLESWERGRCLVLKRHDGYHGHCTGNVLRVELYALPEHADRLQRYAADELDVLGITYFSPQEREAARQRYAGEYISAPRLCTFYLVFDVERSPFEDPRVRRALALATDREALADGVLQGSVSPATGGLVPLGMPGHSPRAGLPYDPERARRLLAEAGYPDGRGFPAVRALAFRAVEPRCHYLQAQWREQLGIEVVWEVVEWVPFLRALRESKPALFTAMWMADYPDPDNLLRVSRGDHWSAWRDETYDTLVERARRVLDQGARLALYAQAERVLTEEVPVLPLTYERDHLLIKPWVRRYPMSGSKSIFWKDVLMGPTP